MEKTDPGSPWQIWVSPELAKENSIRVKSSSSGYSR